MSESAVEVLLKQLITRIDNLEADRNQKKKIITDKLTQDDFDAIDNEINFEWWFEKYGESPHPARFMNQQNLPYSREETIYLFSRMKEMSPQKVNGGTHVFQFAGKVYCKATKSTVNCFACIPITRPIEQ